MRRASAPVANRGAAWRRVVTGIAAPAVVMGILTGCSASPAADAGVTWHPHASCPAPSAVSAALHSPEAAFARSAGGEEGPATTGCTYTASHETQVIIGTQSGSPGNVDYNDAGGIHNASTPALGQGAHTGTAAYFCGAAVPAKGGTLTVVVSTTATRRLDCDALTPLVRDAATWG